MTSAEVGRAQDRSIHAALPNQHLKGHYWERENIRQDALPWSRIQSKHVADTIVVDDSEEEELVAIVSFVATSLSSLLPPQLASSESEPSAETPQMPI